MSDNPFSHYEMCDGGGMAGVSPCPDRQKCARWHMRCDVDRCTQYVNFVRQAPPPGGCPYHLPCPDEHYPAKQE